MINFKKLLLEGKYDRLVTNLSRRIINDIKKKKKPKKIVYSNISYGNIEFDLIVKINWNWKNPNNWKASVSGETTLDDALGVLFNTIYIYIFIHPDLSPGWINELIFQLKNYLRHEIEHVVQNTLGKFKGMWTDNLPNKKYLTNKSEIPAFVAGLYKQAKTQKIPFYRLVDDYLSLWNDLTDNDRNKIKKLWFDYAKKNFPKAQLKK